jgi:hypothetical protein
MMADVFNLGVPITKNGHWDAIFLFSLPNQTFVVIFKKLQSLPLFQARSLIPDNKTPLVGVLELPI